ncbi:CBL-interacting protein kinase [Trebouxia sp. C0009 RCD-2024]
MDPELEPCPGSSRYLRSPDPTQRILGIGGACLSVEKWWDTKQHSWVAVKHLDGTSKLVKAELQVLRHIAAQAVPRTVVTLDEVRHGPKSVYVVLELIQGMTLQDYCREFVDQGQLAAAEDRMLPVAAQLFDTLQVLHERAHVAHMDLTSVNVMIRHDALKDWDNVRTLDFGYSRSCQAGARDVTPKGMTPEYAATEVLTSVMSQLRKDRCQLKMIDGPPADVFSAGIVLYQMLTGCVPFSTYNMDLSKIPVPKEVSQKAREQWQMAAAVLQLHTSWVQALAKLQNGEAVQHSILDNIRRCSSTPDEAVSFFTKILHPVKQLRPSARQALEHPYIRRCAEEMRAYLESQTVIQTSRVPAKEEEVQAKPGRRKLLAQMGGAVRKQGGRLARTAGHVLKCLPLFKGRRTSASDGHTACSSKTNSPDSSSRPPLSAHFFPYKHRAEQHSPTAGHNEANACEGVLQNQDRPDATGASANDKVCSGAIRVQAWTSRQPPGTDQPAESDVSKVCAKPAGMLVGQVAHIGHPKQPVLVEKEQACSALSAVPAAGMPSQPDLHHSAAERRPAEELQRPVLSASRPKRRGWMKKLAVAGAVAGVGYLLNSFCR